MGLRYFKFGVDKMPQWFIHLVGEKRVQIRKTPENILCCRFKDKDGNDKEVLKGTVITNDMFE